MSPTETFARARRVLLDNRDDLEKARAAFRWPTLEAFNWAWDWFEVLAKDNHAPALTIVSDAHGVSTSSFAALAERSTRVARYFFRLRSSGRGRPGAASA